MGAAVTRRGLLSRASGVAGAVAAIAGGIAPNLAGVAQAGVSALAKVSGKLQVVQMVDFHPDHNAFIKTTVTEWAEKNGIGAQLDLSDLSAFVGGSDVYQKLQAQKAANQPVDLIMNALSGRVLSFFNLTRDSTVLEKSLEIKYGAPNTGARATHFVDGKWVGLPFYDRSGNYWVREDKFAAVGMSIEKGSFDTWDKLREACLAVSRPSENFYGWGMTVNRSGDGESLVQTVMQQFGGALADVTGEKVTLYSPETIDAMQWLADCYLDRKYQDMVPPGVNAWNDLSNNEAYLAGVIGFTSNAGTIYAKAKLDGNPVGDSTMLVPVPFGPSGLRLQGSAPHYLYLMQGSQNFEASVALGEHLLSEEIQRKMWSISYGYTVPAWAKYWDHPDVTSNRIAMAFKPVAFNEPPFQGIAYRGPLSEAAEAVNQEVVMTDMMGEILGGKRVDLAVRDAHLRSIQLYKSFGLKGE